MKGDCFQRGAPRDLWNPWRVQHKEYMGYAHYPVMFECALIEDTTWSKPVHALSTSDTYPRPFPFPFFLLI
jgi:hypothetical protein